MINKAFAAVLATLVSTTTAVGFASKETEKVLALEQSIVAIARENTLRQDNLETVREALTPLVTELLTLVPDLPEKLDSALVAGAWKSEWSNLFIDPRADLTQVYQVVFPEGFYYNLSRYVDPNGTERTNFLRGAFTDNGNDLAIEFTSDRFATGWLPKGSHFQTAVSLAERGFFSLETDGTSRAVGQKGNLRNAYVSPRVRIITGSSVRQPNRLFVLTRAEFLPE